MLPFRVLAAVAVMGVVWPGEAAARATEVEWKYQRFTVPEAVLTGTLGLGIGALILFHPEKPPQLHGGILGEDAVRDATRGDSISTRRSAALIGDLTYYGSMAYPYLVDVIAVAWIGHGKPEVAAQMAMINTEAFAITGFLSFASNAFIRRQRPYAADCTNSNEATFPDCKLGGKSESFFSGHFGIAATAAGLTCAHHANLPLYGGGAPDVLACAATIAGAMVTGYTRLIADKHYLYDVLVGGALGFPIGYFIADYHYRHPRSSSSSSTAWLVRPMPLLTPTTAGAAAVGIF